MMTAEPLEMEHHMQAITQSDTHTDNAYTGTNLVNHHTQFTVKSMKDTTVTIERPQEWPLSRKLHVSAVAWFFSFVAYV